MYLVFELAEKLGQRPSKAERTPVAAEAFSGWHIRLFHPGVVPRSSRCWVLLLALLFYAVGHGWPGSLRGRRPSWEAFDRFSWSKARLPATGLGRLMAVG